MNVSTNLKVIIVLSVIAIILSGYLLYTKYTGVTSFCDFSPEVSCDAVSQSPYSELPANSGIPISGLGIIAYLLFIIPAGLLLRSKNPKNVIFGLSELTVHYLMMLWGLFSMFFYVYLTYLELYVIYSICTLCVVTFIIGIIVFILTILNVRSVRSKKGEKK